MGKNYQYYVEGEDEEKIVKVLKTELRLIEPGKIEKFNVVSEQFTNLRVMSLKMGTVVVLVFDTDAGNIDILKKNIEFLKKQKSIKKVLCITQVKCLEDELKRERKANEKIKKQKRKMKKSKIAQNKRKSKFNTKYSERIESIQTTNKRKNENQKLYHEMEKLNK